MAKTANLLADGWRWHQAGDFHRAEQAYRQLLRREPRNAQGWYLLGILSDARGDTPAAAASLEQALHLRSDYAEALHYRGIVFARQGELTKAEAQFREALRLQPSNAQVHNNL